MSDAAYDLWGLAIGMASGSLARQTVENGARVIERLQTENRNMNNTIASNALEIHKLRTALTRIAEHNDFQSDFPHDAENLCAFARAALGK